MFEMDLASNSQEHGSHRTTVVLRYWNHSPCHCLNDPVGTWKSHLQCRLGHPRLDHLAQTAGVVFETLAYHENVFHAGVYVCGWCWS